MTPKCMLFLLLLIPSISGCLGQDQGKEGSGDEPNQPPSPPNGVQSQISIFATNDEPSTVRKAISLDIAADVTAVVNFTATGPKWKGVTVLQHSVQDPETYMIHGFTWARDEYARTVLINEMTGQRETTCLGNQTPDGQCEIFGGEFGQYNPRVLNNPETIWLKGKTRVIIDGEFQGLFSVNITFSSPVSMGAVQDIQLNSTRFAPDLLGANFMDIERCIQVGFCGSIIGGSFELPLPTGHVGYLRLQGHSDPAAFLHACINGFQPGPGSGCIVGTPTIGLGYFQTFVVREDATLTLNAGGAPYQEGTNDGLSSFYLGGRMTAFPA